MGIKNLKVILNQKCQLAINTRKLDSYRGMTLGIDLSIYLYKYLYNNDDHIEGLTRLIFRLLKNQITPFFVFDGKPPKEKDDTIQERKEKKDVMNIKKSLLELSINNNNNHSYSDFKNIILGNLNKSNESYVIDEEDIKILYEKSPEELKIEMDKLNKKIIYVTQDHINTSKKLFDLLGIKYIHIDCEAEGLLSMLCKNNVIDGCISEDTDILANGGYLFLRNFNADKNTIDEYCLEGILNSMNFTHDQFVDMCILCGCDYTPKINGLGPISAYKLISKYGNIEEFIKNNIKYNIPENFDYKVARKLFQNPVSKEIYDSIDKNTKLSMPNIKDLKEFLKSTKLKEKFFNEIDKNLMNYYLNIDGINQYEDSTKLKKITDFFIILKNNNHTNNTLNNTSINTVTNIPTITSTNV
jgi:flap endonuclease-1